MNERRPQRMPIGLTDAAWHKKSPNCKNTHGVSAFLSGKHYALNYFNGDALSGVEALNDK